ncbi:MAG: YraN family protein [Aestuariibacter sp.]
MRWISGLKARYNGEAAERQAKQYLQNKQLRFREANYRCKMGEIDLIMMDSEQLVFVEVKSRENAQFGHAAEYFTQHKQQKLEKAINHYLLAHKLNPYNTDYRVDVVAITGEDIQWYQAVQ